VRWKRRSREKRTKKKKNRKTKITLKRFAIPGTVVVCYLFGRTCWAR
jgi:hypothetical protein